jgi:hypothetical protein
LGGCAPCPPRAALRWARRCRAPAAWPRAASRALLSRACPPAAFLVYEEALAGRRCTKERRGRERAERARALERCGHSDLCDGPVLTPVACT